MTQIDTSHANVNLCSKTSSLNNRTLYACIQLSVLYLEDYMEASDCEYISFSWIKLGQDVDAFDYNLQQCECNETSNS